VTEIFLIRWFRSAVRFIRRKLVVPMFSSRRPPEFAARGVLFGVFFAFTPLVGIQLAAIVAFWSFIRTFIPRWDFNLIVAMAWIWVTNVFTLGPIYYGFVLTGQAMLGRWDEPLGYEAFTSRLEALLAARPDASWLEEFWYGTISVLDAFGLPLFLGCVPWAVGLAWVGYFWSLRFVRRRNEMRERRRAQRRNRGHPASENAV